MKNGKRLLNERRVGKNNNERYCEERGDSRVTKQSVCLEHE